MKIMHLADLHLGKFVMDRSMIDDQVYIIDEIISIVRDKLVDVVLIAGDIYDKSVPSVSAVNLFSDFLVRLNKLGVKVFVVSGNHDSSDRLSFGNELFCSNDIYIEGSYKGELVKKVLYDEYGEVNIYMLPFVKPVDVRRWNEDFLGGSYDDAIEFIVNNTFVDTSKRNIIMVHQFVTGSGIDILGSDSLEFSLGGLDNVDVKKFMDFDYVALGHVHRGQKLLSDNIRYAGSPLKYSFNEVNYDKGVVIVNLLEKGKVDVSVVPLKPLRDMRVIRGRFSELIDRDSVNLSNFDDYVCAVITDDDYVVDAIGKLREVYKNVLKVVYDNKRSIVRDEINFEGEFLKKDIFELFSDFYYMQNNVKLEREVADIALDVIREVNDEASEN